MRLPVCTIDSSCLISLDHLRLLKNLVFLFSQVLIPKAVRDEVFKRRIMKDRLQNLFDTYAFIQRCDHYEKGAVEFLLKERSRQNMRDRGEVEAIVQASQIGATVLVDDAWGRDQTEKHDLDRHGTLWILEQFFNLALMTSSDVRASFESLRARGTRLPRKDINEFLARIDEEPL